MPEQARPEPSQPYSVGVDLMAMVLATGWASGVNAYAAVALLGVLGRFAGVDDVPESLQGGDVIALSGGMYAVEFVTDKIPYVDSLWDTVSTIIRPTLGAMLGYLIAGQAESTQQALYAAVGGGSALASHVVKAAIRLGVNGSPEPFTNVTVSLGEDVAVAGVVLLAVVNPWLALAVAAVLFLVGVSLLVVLWKLVRRGWRRWQARRDTRAGRDPADVSRRTDEHGPSPGPDAGPRP